MTALICVAAVACAALVVGMMSVVAAWLSMRDQLKQVSKSLREAQAFLLSAAMATDSYTRNRLGYDIGMNKEQLKDPQTPDLQETTGPRSGLVLGPHGAAVRRHSEAATGTPRK